MRGHPSREGAPLHRFPNFLQSSSQDIRPNCLGGPLSFPVSSRRHRRPRPACHHRRQERASVCLQSALLIFAEQGERASEGGPPMERAASGSKQRMRSGREIPNQPTATDDRPNKQTQTRRPSLDPLFGRAPRTAQRIRPKERKTA